MKFMVKSVRALTENRRGVQAGRGRQTGIFRQWVFSGLWSQRVYVDIIRLLE